jgi:hypothetical protein
MKTIDRVSFFFPAAFFRAAKSRLRIICDPTVRILSTRPRTRTQIPVTTAIRGVRQLLFAPDGFHS